MTDRIRIRLPAYRERQKLDKSGERSADSTFFYIYPLRDDQLVVEFRNGRWVSVAYPGGILMLLEEGIKLATTCVLAYSAYLAYKTAVAKAAETSQTTSPPSASKKCLV